MDFIGPDSDSIQNQTPATSGGFVGPDTDTIPDIGKGESFVRGAVRNFPMAEQAKAFIEPGDYAQNIKEDTAKAEASKAANPWSYGAGAVTGGALPMAIPGVGEAMAASYPAAMVGGGALGAMQSLSDTPLDKNPGDIATKAATGAGMGAAGGAVGQWLSSLIPTPDQAEAGALLQKFKLPARGGASTLGNDIVGGAQDLASTVRTPTPSGASLNNMADFPLRNAQQINRAIGEYGDEIGNIVSKVGSDLPVNPEFLKEAIAGLKDDSLLPVSNQHLDTIIKSIDDAADKKTGNLTFGKLRGLTRDVYHELVNEDPQTGRLMPGSGKALEAWKLLRGFQDDVVGSEAPELLPKFQAANNHYSNLVGLQKALNRVAVASENKQTNIGGIINPLSLLTKAGNAAASATGLNRAANNLPFKIMPAVNAVRGVIPRGVQQSELADYLSSKFGKKE